jgi:hypothetical protein
VEEIVPPASPAAVAGPAEGAEGVAPPDIPADDHQIAQCDFVEQNINVASHNSFSNDETEKRNNRRQHGGALPH